MEEGGAFGNIWSDMLRPDVEESGQVACRWNTHERQQRHSPQRHSPFAAEEPPLLAPAVAALWICMPGNVHHTLLDGAVVNASKLYESLRP
eukprot:7386346-Prymnesium_polylepis.2